MNQKSKQILVSVLFLFSIFLFPSMTFAQATPTPAPDSGSLCTCFCGTADRGAEYSKSIGDKKITKDKCEAFCKAEEHQMVVCAKTMRQFPSNNAICFDKQACDDQKGVFADPPYQPPECPDGWKYCFPTAEKSTLKLSTKIGNLETVGDLGAYVSELYKWMVGVAGFFAIIMVMIGGFQYVLGGAASDQISKAKERMKNGVIGIVLLFCVVLILQTVNPQLLKLEVPRPSKIREINLASDSCEKLLAQDYTIIPEEGSKAECGGTAVIKSGPGGKKVADGLTCAYTKCANGACVSRGINTAGQCMECHTISNDNPNSRGIPSTATCQAASVFNIDSSGNGTDIHCQFMQEGDDLPFNAAAQALIPGAVVAAQLEDLDEDSCMEVVIDCGVVGQDCEKYDDLPVKIFDDDALEEWPLHRVDTALLGSICQSDPCKINKKTNQKIKCVWDGDADCDNK